LADEQQQLPAQLDDLLGVIEKLCAECENAWGKDSPQAQQMRNQPMATQVPVDSVRQIEKDDSEIYG